MDSRKVKLQNYAEPDLEGFAKPRELDDHSKLNAFVSGPSKKSKYVKEKEAAEAKKKEEEELAAKAYEDFVAVFDSNDRSGSGRGKSGSGQSKVAQGKTFVRAGASGGPAALYNPIVEKAEKAATSTSERPQHSKLTFFENEDVRLQLDKSHRALFFSPSIGKGHFNFMETQIPVNFYYEDRKDAEREGRLGAKASKDPRGMSITALAALETAPYLSGGSRDTGDPLTTNVHVGNLPGTISEQTLGAFCVKWGPIVSLKIMWPRSGSDNIGGAGYGMVAMRQTKSGGLNGFVSYMRRSDAERACRELDGFDWGGNILRTGWGKAMPMPPGHKAQFELPRESRMTSRSPSPKRRRYAKSSPNRDSRRRRRSRSTSSPDSRDYDRHRRSRSRSDEDRGRSSKRRRQYDSRSRSRSMSRSRSVSYDRSRSRSRSYRSRTRSRSRNYKDNRIWPKLPNGEEEEKFITTVAKKVLEHGERFERTLREREKSNPKFNFLIESDAPAHHYFRMLIDRHYRPPSPPPPTFADEGYASIYSTDSAEDSENERLPKGKLGKYSRKRFQAMLRSVTPQRERIARCMAFALHHADAADEVAEILVQSLTIDMTPIPRKLARLYVISDILHNSSNSLPNAWKYRQVLEKLLPDVFDHLNLIYRSFPGRIKAETFKKQITVIVNVWSSFMVFSQTSIDDFNIRLVKMDEEEIDGDGIYTGPEGDDVDGMVVEEWNDENPEIDGELGGNDVTTRSNTGFAPAFKPAVMEKSSSTSQNESETGPVKLSGAIKLL
ncbi:uncharacterized protein MELLADRAFT_85661 [Melampsora larici-populina 98AG31]|uniref:Uncharacterized protein n=1 Tax=Melampsora larici-populina (strain 98AG31 / pathotype 3-4-7) TaxID=747676 RepID=F4RJC3_MELLP|nr:uncharacterized protein MELLADRAFT_85661 [Melampsora larici-populina 98AG31]EGG07287.1 hypothetical protein MELLADRAFT_85661 [Melampsora larici-populina 98AG31]